MRRSWAVRLLLLLLAFQVSAGCVEGKGKTPSEPPVNREAEAVLKGWMGRFSARDEGLRRLLSGQPGWSHFRDMELFEAIQAFEGGTEPEDRLGAARSYLVFADFFASLDRLFLESEQGYLEAKGDGPDAGERLRLGFVRLRRGDLRGAAAAFAAEGAADLGFGRDLGKIGVAVRSGQREDVQRLLGQAAPSRDAAERQLDRVCRYLWDLPGPGQVPGTYADAVTAVESGDLAGAVMTLQMLDFSSLTPGPAPELFLYDLLRKAFAGLALAAAGHVDTVGGRFYAAQAWEHLGKYDRAADAYRTVDAASLPERDASWLYSPYTGVGEASLLARVGEADSHGRAGREDEAAATRARVNRDGRSPLVTLALARSQAAGGKGPLERPVEAAEGALRELLEVPARLQKVPQAELLDGLYPVRIAAASRLAATVHRATGADWKALDVMERAHRKSGGYRPDFANPPGFMADLARTRFGAGQYASAVGVLFELAGEFPSARLAYESVKRLYASRTGGDVPPR